MENLNAAPALAAAATPAVADAAVADAAAVQAPATINPEYLLKYAHDGLDAEAEIDLSKIPADVRMNFLRSAVRAFVTNRVSTAESRTKKANLPFEQYDAATAVDPLQTAVPKPEGEKSVTDFAGIVSAAIAALYDGTAGKKVQAGEGRKSREPKDPLVSQITKAVIADVYKKNKAANASYKYTDATKEVGADGLAYLNALIEAKVAAGEDRKALEDFREARYVKPARIMLGLDTPGKLKDAVGIL